MAKFQYSLEDVSKTFQDFEYFLEANANGEHFFIIESCPDVIQLLNIVDKFAQKGHEESYAEELKKMCNVMQGLLKDVKDLFTPKYSYELMECKCHHSCPLRLVFKKDDKIVAFITTKWSYLLIFSHSHSY